MESIQQAMDAANTIMNSTNSLSATTNPPPPIGDLIRSNSLKKLDLLASEIGLQYHADESLVTICGQVFLVDIEVDAQGEIVKVKLSYASDSDLTQSDEVSIDRLS